MLASREKLILRTEHRMRCGVVGIICGLCKGVFCSACDPWGAYKDQSALKNASFGICGECVHQLPLKPQPPSSRRDVWEAASQAHKRSCAPGAQHRKRSFCAGCNVYGCKACQGSWTRFTLLGARPDHLVKGRSSRAFDFCGKCFRRFFGPGGFDGEESLEVRAG